MEKCVILPSCFGCYGFQALRSELKEREHLVVSTLDQARMFLADQPIEGPGEPRKTLQPKTGLYTVSLDGLWDIFILGNDVQLYPPRQCSLQVDRTEREMVRETA